ncbi:MAG: SAVED domain-containing protein [Massilibacteroides sp.]|nr:SAVED domain-containing protein [Massilibacteroides sp.]MDD4115370.1 SAVED domain-containing protein [Massilibacteroides sp.]MDD4661397.1 SAVED domain-containing protein [Massilibacteroides sp.]
MTKQIRLIGEHPDNTHPFGKWLAVNDLPDSDSKCHRELTESTAVDDDLIEWMARKIINHHYTQFRIDRLKEKYRSLGFTKYAEQHRKLPIADKVKKGNATEILLTDYIQTAQKKEFIKVFKLKYNPNVDQAIKGDDTLMVDLFEENENEKIKIYLGESKFRKTPSKAVIADIAGSLSKDTLPLSYTFLVEEIAKTDESLARKLDDYIVQDIKDRGDLIYAGLLLSNTDTSEKVETHLSSDNPNLVFISVGIDEPEEFIKAVFEKAEELISNPDLL